MTDRLAELQRMFEEYDEAVIERVKTSTDETDFFKREDRFLTALEEVNHNMDIDTFHALVDVSLAADALLWVEDEWYDTNKARLVARLNAKSALCAAILSLLSTRR